VASRRDLGDPALSATHHRRNTLLLGSVEVGWGFAMAVIQAESVLPALLVRLGADYATLAYLPAITYGASFPFELASPYATERLPQKRLLVWVLHSVVPFVWAALGLWLIRGDTHPSSGSLAIFYAGFLAATGLLGFLIPLWYDFMGKITDPLRRGSAFSTIFALQSLAGCLGAFVSERVLASDSASGASLAPARFGVCYLIAASFAFVGNQAFLFTQEVPAPPSEPRPSIREYLHGFLGFVRGDRTLRRYILARAATRLAPMVATYFSVEAIERFGSAAPVGYFTLCLIAGKLLTSVLSWRFSDAIGMKPFLVGGIVALAAAGAIVAGLEWRPVPALGLAPYFVTAFLTGVYNVADGSAHATFVMNLAPEGKRASYLTTVNGAVLPLTIGVPIAGGLVARGIGLAPVQALAAAVFVGAALFVAAAIPERRPSVRERDTS
jgi:hypothetical protein